MRSGRVLHGRDLRRLGFGVRGRCEDRAGFAGAAPPPGDDAIQEQDREDRRVNARLPGIGLHLPPEVDDGGCRAQVYRPMQDLPLLAPKPPDGGRRRRRGQGNQQKKGEEALEVSKQSTAQATEGAATVKASIEGTKSVAESIEKINNMLVAVGKGVEQGVVAVEQVVKAIDEVSAISQESASASEENSSAMEEQAASMNQLAQTSGKLSEVASQLQKEIDKFKL